MKKTNAITKNSELISVLNLYFKGKVNLARVKLISYFIIALCKVQTVTFEKLANAFDTKSDASSSLRRIQRFIAGYTLDSDLIARLVFSLLPQQDTVILTIDRINWKFGKTDINIFMLGIVYKSVAFPLLFTMLAKRGNPNSKERIGLINRFIKLFGKEIIESIVADREFVGKQWLEYLNNNKIRYYIRIRNNFKVFIPHKNKEIKASHLFNQYRANEFIYYPKIVYVNGQLCYLSGCKLDNSGGRLDFLIIVSFNKPEKALYHYKERWQIEICFKAMKSSRFDIKNTHLKDIQRIEKLILLIMIAFVWCYKVRDTSTSNKTYSNKNNERMAKSIFKHGLSFIENTLLNSENQNDTNIFQFLSCT